MDMPWVLLQLCASFDAHRDYMRPVVNGIPRNFSHRVFWRPSTAGLVKKLRRVLGRRGLALSRSGQIQSPWGMLPDPYPPCTRLYCGCQTAIQWSWRDLNPRPCPRYPIKLRACHQLRLWPGRTLRLRSYAHHSVSTVGGTVVPSQLRNHTNGLRCTSTELKHIAWLRI